MINKSVVLIATLLVSARVEANSRPPVIDMHLHAYRMHDVPPGAPACPGDQRVLIPTIDPREELDFSKLLTCKEPILAAKDDADLREKSIAALRRHNCVLR